MRHLPGILCCSRLAVRQQNRLRDRLWNYVFMRKHCQSQRNKVKKLCTKLSSIRATFSKYILCKWWRLACVLGIILNILETFQMVLSLNQISELLTVFLLRSRNTVSSSEISYIRSNNEEYFFLKWADWNRGAASKL